MSGLQKSMFAAGFMIVGGVATVGVDAVAQSGVRGHRGGAHALHRLIQDLDFDDEQQVQMDMLREDARAHRQQHRQQQQEDLSALVSMLGDAELDGEMIHNRIDGRLDGMRIQAHAMADELLAIHASLDVDQRAALVENAAEMGARSERGHDRIRSRLQDQVPQDNLEVERQELP